MTELDALSYDIEQLYIEGYGPRLISQMLECPVDLVYQWIETNGVEAEEEHDLYYGA